MSTALAEGTGAWGIFAPALPPRPLAGVLGDGGALMLSGQARRGVQVRVLTNSLASSDESVVHAGYLKRRVELLRAGVQLYELKPGAADSSLRVRGRFGPASDGCTVPMSSSSVAL